MALSRWIDSKGSIVVTPSQVENAVAHSLPRDTVAFVTFENVENCRKFVCDSVCTIKSFRRPLHGISAKRLFEYGYINVNIYEFVSYESTNMRPTTFNLHSKSYGEEKDPF